jgi:hypothetical protein
MRVIDRSALVEAENKAGVLTRAVKSLERSWTKKDAEAQEAIVAALNKVLDNRYVMLRNVTLEGPDVPIPLILIGPPGVKVIYPSTLKGVYRAREEIWEELDDRTQRFTVARPNLLTRTALMARAIGTYLSSNGFELPEVEPVLFFSDPGVHVDSVRPVVRVVLSDAMDRFIANLTQSRVVLDVDDIQNIVKAMVGDIPLVNSYQQLPERDAFSFQDLAEERPLRPTKRVVIDKSEPAFLKGIPFTRRQLFFLGLLTLVNIIILVALVVLVLISS